MRGQEAVAPAVHTDRIQCRFCSKFVSPHQIMGAIERGFACEDCVRWHIHSMEVVGGAQPHGCQECGKTWAELTDQAQRVPGGAEVRMYAVPKDGIYQLLCRSCKDKYIVLRSDVYGKTQYGAQLKLS